MQLSTLPAGRTMVMAYKLAMRGIVVLCFVVISMDVLGAAASGVLQPRPMYVFGDSTVDVGNNNFLPGPYVPRANMSYYGIDFPGVPAGRYSNGFNIADFIGKSMGFVSSPPPYLMLATSPDLLVATALEIGVNYASGGSGILDVTNYWQQNIPLSRQVRQYFNDTKAKMVAAAGSAAAVDALLASSVFLISVSNNDLTVFANWEVSLNRSASQQQSDAAAFLAYLISNYSAIITELYAMGARKFAIINAGLIGCVPAARLLQPLGACAEGVNQLAAGFNVALRSLIATDLAPRLPGFVYSLADSFGLMHDFFADPPAWGFTDIASACCGDGFLLAQSFQCLPNSTVCPTRSERDHHVFWDPFHFSQRACFLTAQAFYNGPAKYTMPINFMQLAQSS